MTRNNPTTHPDATAHPDPTGVSSALRFLQAFDARVQFARGPALGLDAHVQPLAAAWKRVGIDPAPVLEAVDAYAAGWDRHCRSRAQSEHEVAAYDPGVLLTNERAAIQHALRTAIVASATPAETDDERAARTVVSDLEAALSSEKTTLDRAVGAGDLDEVMRLRARVQVELPGELAEARLRLLDLRLSISLQAAAAGDELVELERGQRAAAQELVEQRRQDLVAAEAAVEFASERCRMAGGIREQLTAPAEALQSERDRLICDTAEARERRVRALAGLTS